MCLRDEDDVGGVVSIVCLCDPVLYSVSFGFPLNVMVALSLNLVNMHLIFCFYGVFRLLICFSCANAIYTWLV